MVETGKAFCVAATLGFFNVPAAPADDFYAHKWKRGVRKNVATVKEIRRRRTSSSIFISP